GAGRLRPRLLRPELVRPGVRPELLPAPAVPAVPGRAADPGLPRLGDAAAAGRVQEPPLRPQPARLLHERVSRSARSRPPFTRPAPAKTSAAGRLPLSCPP